jgi:membrane-bound ClpP family serine protease
MKQKWSLFAGILFLILGIVLRKSLDFNTIGLILIIGGVLLKTYYIINKIVLGEYKPGFEILFLVFGLTIFLSRYYLHAQIAAVPAGVFMGIGIGLKIVFIVLFVRKTKIQARANSLKESVAG